MDKENKSIGEMIETILNEKDFKIFKLQNETDKQNKLIHILAKELTRFYDETEEDIIKKLSEEND